MTAGTREWPRERTTQMGAAADQTSSGRMGKQNM